MSRDDAPAVQRPWWLERGDAICFSCDDAFHPEATVRCEDCDELMCATCVVEVQDEGVAVLCRACAEARR